MSGQDDGLWVQSDIASDGRTYVVTVSMGDRVWTLTRDEALAYAAAVVRAGAVADYDSAVLRLLTQRLGLDQRTAAAFVANDVRPDRPPLDDAATSPLAFEPGVSAFTGDGFLTLRLDGEAVGQLDVPTARGHATHALEAAAAVDLDAGLYQALVGAYELEPARARAVVADVGNHRGAA